ncbi:MAG: hypothetical protein ABJA78_04910 [Ferruginibacter sp.]
MNKKITIAVFYFFLSTAITWWFIQASPLYTSLQQKLLSCSIAGAKWGLQIMAALLFLKEKKWHFIKNISFTCLAGSIILLPYAVMSSLWNINDNNFFIGSLGLAVAVMILLYALSVKNAGIKIYWWLGWLCCLAVAITLQLTVVFHAV